MPALLVYLLLTILFELPIFLLFWRKEGWLSAIVFCLLVNGFTNPVLNLILTQYDVNVWLLEICVVVVEMLCAMLIFKPKWSKALLFSFAANAFSYSVGVLLFEIGWL
ncbi:MAG: hypothetical protein RLZZ519_2738 [Bacteroidota bacterium]